MSEGSFREAFQSVIHHSIVGLDVRIHPLKFLQEIARGRKTQLFLFVSAMSQIVTNGFGEAVSGVVVLDHGIIISDF
jgi:hypothetical protein